MLGTYKQLKENFWVVKLEDDEEIFVFKTKTLWAYTGDFVDVRITKNEENWKRREWRIVKILARTENQLVGKFIQAWKNLAFVQVINSFWKDIYIPEKFKNWAKKWDIVIVRIKWWNEKPFWEIVKIIWQQWWTNLEEIIMLAENSISLEFSSQVKKEAKFIEYSYSKKESLEREIKKRRDLRNEFIVTIDWEDAKDLDDAIQVEKLSNGNYRLGVHIADVAHYVKEDSQIDREAQKRATSIYLPEMVIPMLPKELSNNLCSLNPNEPKLTLSIFVEIDNTWNVVNREVFESIIESKYRLTYNEVAEIINGKNPQNREQKLLDMLNTARDLKNIISKKRIKDWKIDFDFPELKVIMWENGKVLDVYKYDRNEAYLVIEEFMVMANEEISRFFSNKKIPFLYRYHSEPEKWDLEKLSLILANYWVYLNPEDASPKKMAQIIASLWEKDYKYFLLKLILRSMSKACYSEKDIWHFGLSLWFYSHFTSPIRRYPDLQIHRIIKKFLQNKLDSKRIAHYKKILKNIADVSSAREVLAEDLERKIKYLKIIDFMSDKIWQEFSWIISGITENGFFVELENWVEWFVHKNTTKKLFIPDLDNYSFLIWKEKFFIGKNINISVIDANRELRRLDFEFVC